MEFRYRITRLVDAVVEIDGRVLRFRQALRQVQVPLGNIRAFAVQRRDKGLFSLVLSELVMKTEPQPGVVRVVRLPLDPDSEGGKGVVAALGKARPDADASGLGWTEAAARLGVPARRAVDYFLNKWGLWGTTLFAGAVAMGFMDRLMFPTTDPDKLKTRAITQVVVVAIGVALIVIGAVTTRRKG